MIHVMQCDLIIRLFKEVKLNATNISVPELALTLATSLNRLCENVSDKKSNLLWFSL